MLEKYSRGRKKTNKKRTSFGYKHPIAAYRVNKVTPYLCILSISYFSHQTLLHTFFAIGKPFTTPYLSASDSYMYIFSLLIKYFCKSQLFNHLLIALYICIPKKCYWLTYELVSALALCVHPLHPSANLATSLKLADTFFTSRIDYPKTYWEAYKYLLGILTCLQIYVLPFH